jgi:hypothetical protein
MKIRTITTHDCYNYGSALQTYALLEYLKEQGHEAKVIDFKPDFLLSRYNWKWVNKNSRFNKFKLTRWIYRGLKYVQLLMLHKRIKKFDEFMNKEIDSTRTYYTNEELMQNPPSADAFIVGSDQVWNSSYEQGKCPAYYLEFVKKGKKIAYSASFSITSINESIKPTIKNYLEKFDSIAVREIQGLDILNSLGIHGTWVLDPVFLITTDKWKKLMTPIKKKEKFILIYDFEHNRILKKFALLLKEKTGAKIYAINDKYPLLYADKNIMGQGPKEFLSYIYNCDYFLSNSFHGTAFSIIFEKEFFVFNRLRDKVNSRMESLLTKFNLSTHLIIDESSFNVIDEKIDYSKIESLKKTYLNESKSYLNEALS